MNILVIGTDRSAFRAGSVTQHRFRDYSVFAECNFCFLIPYKQNEEVSLAENVVLKGVAVNKKIFGWFTLLSHALDLVKKKRIDVVTVQDPFFLGSISVLLKWVTGVRVNIQIHGDYFSNEFWKKERLINRLLFKIGLSNLARADSVRVVSERIRDDLIKRGFDADSIVSFPIYTPWKNLALEESKLNIKEKYKQFDFKVLVIGRLEPVKRIDVAINAFASFLKDNPKSGMLIVGSGSQERKLKELVGQKGLRDSVVFVPWTDDIVSYYKGSDCILLTSEYEGWSRVAIEAMACGCPIIMTDVGCAGEAVINNKNGLVIPVNDESAATGALNKIKNNPGLRDEFFENSKSVLERLPNKEKTFNFYKESWEKAIKK